MGSHAGDVGSRWWEAPQGCAAARGGQAACLPLLASASCSPLANWSQPVQAQRRGHLDDLPMSAAPLAPFEFCETSNNGNGSGRKQQAAAPPPSAASPIPSAPRSALLAQLAAGGGRAANAASAPLPPGTPPGGGAAYAASAAQQLQARQAEQPKQATPEKKKKKHGRLWRLMYGEHEGNGMHQPLW